MFLYLTIIVLAVAIISAVNAVFFAPIYGFSVTYSILATVILTVAVFLVDLVIALAVRWLPEKFYAPDKKIFSVFKWERRFYEKLGIRKWKDKIPEMGKVIGFGKDRVVDIGNNLYVYKFMQETVYAEVMHFYSAILGFLIVFITPLKYALNFALPVATVNFILQLLPIFVQRYTRPKLLAVFRRNAARENA